MSLSLGTRHSAAPAGANAALCEAAQAATQPAMSETYDVVVIGAGAGGLTAAGGPAMFGLKAALIEEGEMGGDCLNTGCVPSKALIAAAHRAHEARLGNCLGVALAEPQIDFAAVMAHVHKAIETIAPVDSQERFEGMGVRVIRGRATLIDDRTVEANGERLRAKRIVIATGSRPRLPPIPGIDDVPIFTSENLWEIDTLPRHLAIIGGGAIGMEMAQAFRRLGAAVTLIGDRIMPRDDAEAVTLVAEALRAEGVDIHDGGTVASVAKAGEDIALTLASGETIAASHLLVAAGRTPNVEGFGLETAGVKIGKDGIIVDARRRTSNKRIFAIGDCREGPRFTHASGHDGSVVTQNVALALPAKIDHRALPWTTYTDPEIAQVGLTEAAARERFGDRVSVTREDFSHNDRAIAEGDTQGFVKVVRAKGKVVGATIVGKGAGELILAWSQTITGKASLFALSGAIVPYPNRSDLSRAAAFSAYEPVLFGPWSKRWARLVSKLRS